MVLIGMASAIVIGVLLGIISTKSDKLASVILAVANIIQVFPSLALLAVLMLFFGLGFTTVVIGLFLYALLPIIRYTYVCLNVVDDNILEEGKGVGMSHCQIILHVYVPLSI